MKLPSRPRWLRWPWLRRVGEARPPSPAASRRFVALAILGLAIAFFGGLTYTKSSSDSTNRKIDHRAQLRDSQRRADLAKLQTAIDTAQSALGKANASLGATKAAACFIAEQPPGPGQTPAVAASVLRFRMLIGCTSDPLDGK